MRARTCLLALAALGATAPLTFRENSPQFALIAQSCDAALNGRTIAENSSTDDGPADIILAAQGTTTMQILGFLMDQGSPQSPNSTFFVVNEPMRSGGSEYDFWVAGSPDATTGIATPQVIPAGYGVGFSLVNGTAPDGTAQTELAIEANGTQAACYICNRTLGGAVKQQLFLAFDAAPTGCEIVTLVAEFS